MKTSKEKNTYNKSPVDYIIKVKLKQRSFMFNTFTQITRFIGPKVKKCKRQRRAQTLILEQNNVRFVSLLTDAEVKRTILRKTQRY